MFNFENRKTEYQGIHYTRYIASWNKKGGGFYYGEQFAKWLKANGCTEKEIDDIRELATCGKLELEMNCKEYVLKQKEMFFQIGEGKEPEEEP